MGCGGFTSRKPEGERESIATIRAALDAGISFLDTADFYGMGQSESLIGRALKGRRSQAFLSVKCSMMMSPSGGFLCLDGRPQAISNFASYSLQRLGVDVVDLYQPGRVDPAVPYEESIGAIADLIQEGEVPQVATTKRARLQENLGILDLQLSADELATLNLVFASDAILGWRDPDLVMKFGAQ